MSNTLKLGVCLMFAAALPLAAGCRSEQPEVQEPIVGEAGDAEDNEQALPAEVREALAGLSDDEYTLARLQRVCPVSDQLLGEMGTPIRVDVNGHSVFICCEGCRDELLANSDRYLAELGLAETAVE